MKTANMSVFVFDDDVLFVYGQFASRRDTAKSSLYSEKMHIAAHCIITFTINVDESPGSGLDGPRMDEKRDRPSVVRDLPMI